MKRVMKGLLATAFVGTLLGAGSAEAQGCGTTCCSNWDLSGETLYWASSNGDRLFAQGLILNPFVTDVDNAVAVDVRQITNEPQYDWGFRLGIGYEEGCWFASARYLWLETTSASQAGLRGDENGMRAVQLILGADDQTGWRSLRAHDSNQYQQGEVRYGANLLGRCRHRLALFGSAQVLYLQEKRGTNGVGVPVDPAQDSILMSYRQRSQFSGGGVGFGMTAETDVWCGLALIGEGTLLGVIGSTKSTSHMFALTDGTGLGANLDLEQPNRSRTCLVPALQMRLAAQWGTTCGCTNIAATLGYEWHYYSDALSRAFSRQGSIAYNSGFGGLTLGLNVGF